MCAGAFARRGLAAVVDERARVAGGTRRAQDVVDVVDNDELALVWVARRSHELCFNEEPG